MGSPGNVPISTVTAAVVPVVRLTVREELSVLPLEIVMLLAPPLILPLVMVSGSTISKGAPVGTVALNCPSATFSNDTVRGRGETFVVI